MTIHIRAISEEELPTLLDETSAGFLNDRDVANDVHFSATMDLARTRCAFDGGEMVGTFGAFDFELAVPGATTRMAGTTIVTVRSTHRRKGLLREMMRAHFADARERSEPLAGLWASESGIYERFGYGAATDVMSLSIDPTRGEFSRTLAEDGGCQLIGADEAAKVLPEIYDSLWRERPGLFARTESWWEHRRLIDDPKLREGASRYRFALYQFAGEVRGYVQYRVKEGWSSDGLPMGRVSVVDLQGCDSNARAALWRHLLDVDLVDRVDSWNQPVDSELPWLLADPRRVRRTLRDGLWLRLIDVPMALESRRYAAEGRIVLGVRDAFDIDAQGCYLVEGGPEGAVCRRCTDVPDIELDIADLGSIYLGGHGVEQLARAGRISGPSEALTRAGRMFGWGRAPWCSEIF